MQEYLFAFLPPRFCVQFCQMHRDRSRSPWRNAVASRAALDASFTGGFVWRSPNPGIKCLNNVLLALYFRGYITLAEFAQLHDVIARDPKEVADILWGAFKDCPRTQDPEPGDICFLDGTQHARIVTGGSICRYEFVELYSKKGWLTWLDNERDWCSPWLHEFCPLSEVKDCAFRALWYKLDLSLSFPSVSRGLAIAASDYDGEELVSQNSMDTVWELGYCCRPEIYYLALLKNELVQVLTEVLPSAPGHRYLDGYYYCKDHIGIGLVPSACLNWMP